jgi:hypothetical protein
LRIQGQPRTQALTDSRLCRRAGERLNMIWYLIYDAKLFMMMWQRDLLHHKDFTNPELFCGLTLYCRSIWLKHVIEFQILSW